MDFMGGEYDRGIQGMGGAAYRPHIPNPSDEWLKQQWSAFRYSSHYYLYSVLAYVALTISSCALLYGAYQIHPGLMLIAVAYILRAVGGASYDSRKVYAARDVQNYATVVSDRWMDEQDRLAKEAVLKQEQEAVQESIRLREELDRERQ